MERYDSLESARQEFSADSKKVATIGFFDGVHRGHQVLLGDLKMWAEQAGAEPVVVTFREHPQAVLGSHPPVPVVSLDHRLLLLERAGISATVVLDFDENLRALSPEDFVRDILVDGLGVEGLQMGFDSAFGSRRKGTFEYLEARQDELGLEVRRSRAELAGELAVSSTRVRGAVANWDFSELDILLGHPFSMLGKVVQGDGRGRKLGFPTANLSLPGVSVPSPGVYFCDVLCLGAQARARYSWEQLKGPGPLDGFCPGLMNIGRRPTLTEGEEAASGSFYNPEVDTVEVHLIDYEGDLYGEYLEVFVLAMHRGERKFSSADELVAQIGLDIEARLG